MQVAVGVARSPGGEVRCTYCRASIGAAEPLALCAGCGATLHEACRRELRRCPTPGCEHAPGPRPVSGRQGEARPPGERREVHIKDAEELAEHDRALRKVAGDEANRLLRLVLLLPIATCVGSMGLVALVQGTRGLIAAGLIGAAFSLVAARDLWRARAARQLTPTLRVAMLVLGPAAIGFAAGGAVGAGYLLASLGALLGLGASIADAAAPPRR